jgi:pimeloyl-ACP methyl ester carboxylesterase
MRARSTQPDVRRLRRSTYAFAVSLLTPRHRDQPWPLTFVLVHGVWHGAWCWERFIPEIEAHGHRAIAIDLPIEDGTATFDTYADVVDAALIGSDDVVLVAHSLGAMVIPIVAARRPVRAMTFVCGVMPLLGGKP